MGNAKPVIYPITVKWEADIVNQVKEKTFNKIKGI